MNGGSREGHRACGGFLGPVGTSLAVCSRYLQKWVCTRAFTGNTKKKNEYFLFIRTEETSRRSVQLYDVLESCYANVEIQYHDVPEGGSANVVTLKPNVATYQRVF